MIICSILVSFYVGKLPFIQREQLTGKLLQKGEYKYLVDFSKDAKKKNLIGDYSSRLVDRGNCL